MFPAASVWVATRLFVPALGRVTVLLQAPVPSAAIGASMVPLSYRLTMLLASALPRTTCVGWVAAPPILMMVGASGATLSSVKVRGFEAGLTLPAGSVAVAVRA